MCSSKKITYQKRERIIKELFARKPIIKPYRIIDAVKDFFKRRLLKTPRGVQEARLLKCQSCEHIAFKSHCSVNGSYLEVAVQYIKSACPAGNW